MHTVLWTGHHWKQIGVGDVFEPKQVSDCSGCVVVAVLLNIILLNIVLSILLFYYYIVDQVFNYHIFPSKNTVYSYCKILSLASALSPQNSPYIN
jgi:hypothetical protein